MEMVEATELGSRIAEIQKLCNGNDSDEEFNSHNECALHLQTTLHQMLSDFPSLEIQDVYLHHLKEELNNLHLQTAHLGNQIDLLSKTHNHGLTNPLSFLFILLLRGSFHSLLVTLFSADSILLGAKLGEMECSLHYVTSKDQNNTAEATEGFDSPKLADDSSNLIVANLDMNLQQFELDNKIDEMKLVLKSMQNLQFTVKWFEVLEQIEDSFTNLKVLAFDEHCIRLSLQTYMPTLEGISYLPRLEATIGIDAVELNHELLIEVFEGTMKLKNVQVFPNDIYVNDIVDTAKFVSKSSLQWFIQKVQNRIIVSALRHLVVKEANKSRYSLEYLDKDMTIVAHMAGGIDAYIKLSHDWPIFGSPLKLTHIKGSDDLKRTSLSFQCIVELANSLDTHIRQNISSFVDEVEKVLTEQLQLDLPVHDS